MKKLTEQTKSLKVSEIKRGWKLLDAKGQILGRLATQAINSLTGKNKANYSPNMDAGDNVVIINAELVKVTGKKEDNKVYKRYSGYPGGLKEISYKNMMINNPKEILRHAISGMLPKNTLRKKRLTRLFIFKGEIHTFADKFLQVEK